MKTEVVKFAGKWTVRITQGVQSFHIDCGPDTTKKRANWYKAMFGTALENYRKEIKSES